MGSGGLAHGLDCKGCQDVHQMGPRNLRGMRYGVDRIRREVVDEANLPLLLYGETASQQGIRKALRIEGTQKPALFQLFLCLVRDRLVKVGCLRRGSMQNGTGNHHETPKGLQGLGCRVSGSGFRVIGLSGFGFRVSGSGFKVIGL